MSLRTRRWGRALDGSAARGQAGKRQCAGLGSAQPSARLGKLLLPVALAGGGEVGKPEKTKGQSDGSERPPNRLDDAGFWQVRPTS